VIATSPARTPFAVSEGSGFPVFIHVRIIAATAAAAAARNVFATARFM
jgi:hypothetical protein